MSAVKPPDKERGVILLTTLLIMSLMASVAVMIFDELTYAIRRAANVEAYSGADWYARGAEDFAARYIETQLISGGIEGVEALLRDGSPLVFPVDDGAITLRLYDGGQCLSLNTLESGEGRPAFRQLLTALGWDNLGAAQLTAQAVDWVDSGDALLPDGAEDGVYLSRTTAHRAANTGFRSVGELRVLPGLNAEKFMRLRPFVCARDGSTNGRINVNALNMWQAPLLAAMLGGAEQVALAETLLRDRPSEGWANLDSFQSAPAFNGARPTGADFDALAFVPDYIWIEAIIEHQGARRDMVMEFYIGGDKLSQTFRRQGIDYARPKPRQTQS